MASPDFESMSVEDTVLWLEEQGIPSEYCETFSGMFVKQLCALSECVYSAGNYIDGKEFMKLTESEVRAVVAPIGLAKKIMRLIPKVRYLGRLSADLLLTISNW